MNSILSNQLTPTSPHNFKEFVAMWTPDKAKRKVEEMVQSGQISQQQFEQAKQIANSLLK